MGDSLALYWVQPIFTWAHGTYVLQRLHDVFCRNWQTRQLVTRSEYILERKVTFWVILAIQTEKKTSIFFNVMFWGAWKCAKQRTTKQITVLHKKTSKLLTSLYTYGPRSELVGNYVLYIWVISLIPYQL